MEFVYDLTVDADAENNTHAFALAMVGHNQRVLEVGCATGYFTKVLAEYGCKVVGMELDPAAASVAEEWAERVVIGDADDAGVWDAVDDESFDVVTFGDVLEHLRDPLAALRSAARKLRPSGFIVTSLPNVAHGDVRLSLLHGSFQYRETGLLDRTHMRFFTLQTIRELLRDAGMVVVDTRRVVVPLFDTELGVQRQDYPEAIVAEIQADPEFDTYQFVMKSVIDNGSAAVRAMAQRLEAATDRVQELEASNRVLADKATGYREMQAEYQRLAEQVQTFADHIEDLTAQVLTLHEELGTKAAHIQELERNIESLRDALEESQRARADSERARAESERLHDEIRNSRSYRLTAPLRRLATAIRGPAKI